MKFDSISLRKKTLLIIGITLACLIVLLYTFSSNLLLNGFAGVEERNTQNNVLRAQDALSDDIAQLSTMTRDWAWWDDTYNFIEDANIDYIEANPTDETMANLRINLIMYINSSGGIVFEKGLDMQDRKEVPVPKGMEELINPNSPLLQHSENGSGVSGIILLPKSEMLLASYPILNSDAEGPVRGTLIFGRYLDSEEINRLGNITHLSLDMQRYNDAQIHEDFLAANASYVEEGNIIVKPLNEQRIAGYSSIRDIFGNPALMLRVDLPREIYAQGQAAIQFLFVLLLIIGIIFGVIFLWFLEKLVLSRLFNLNTDVKNIGNSEKLSERVAVTGKDELSNLGVSINKMLEALEHSQEQRKKIEEELKIHKENLEELVEKRTVELRNSNKLLQLGILERKKAEEEVRISEEKYRSLVESSDDSIYMVDRNCNYLFINPRHLSRLGIGDYRGRNYADCHLATQSDIFKLKLNHIFETGIPEQHENEFKGNWFLRTMSPIKNPETKVVTAVTVVSTEITARKKSEDIRHENERLAFANKAKSEFLANMSHELRTPLNSIIGFSELMKQKNAGELNRKQERYVENVLTSSNFLLNLINDILDLSKVEAGKIELVFDTISVPVVINETINLIKEKASKNKVLLKNDFDPDLDIIEADKQRLKQVLFNLLSNAVKFSKKEGGTIMVTTKKDGDMVRISVSDTGIGIKEKDIGKLFKEFEQVDVEISKKYGGTGLGLAITKKLVELHGGKIMVDSVYGEGSTFTFIMPIKAKNGSHMN